LAKTKKEGGKANDKSSNEIAKDSGGGSLTGPKKKGRPRAKRKRKNSRIKRGKLESHRVNKVWDRGGKCG